MKCVALIPIKKNSSRVKNKNFKRIGNKKLYQFFIDKIKKCGFDEIYVDSDSNEIKNYCEKRKVNFINRKNYIVRESFVNRKPFNF